MSFFPVLPRAEDGRLQILKAGKVTCYLRQNTTPLQLPDAGAQNLVSSLQDHSLQLEYIPKFCVNWQS